MRTDATRARSIEALLRSALALRPEAKLDERNYLTDLSDTLVEGISIDAFAADLAAGAGKELQGKFLAPHSSSALAVNSFAWFANGAEVPVPGHEDLRLVGFERRFPTGLTRAQPPHLDVVLESPSELVAIESKCLEYLTPQQAKFSPRYREAIRDERMASAWFAEMLRLMDGNGEGYRFLDVAQLIKHALGLSYRASRPTVLLYLWWEPLNAAEHSVFAQHRAEVAHFASRVSGAFPSIEAMTYPELWRTWLASGDSRLRQHAERLKERYALVI
jgi:hypothetical protein